MTTASVRFLLLLLLLLLAITAVDTTATAAAAEKDVVELEVVGVDGSTAETLEMLEEEERANVRRRRKKLQVGALLCSFFSLVGEEIGRLMFWCGCDPESLLADFDHDGRVGSSEIQQIKDNLHQFFDTDESGSIDTREISTVRRMLTCSMLIRYRDTDPSYCWCARESRWRETTRTWCRRSRS